MTLRVVGRVPRDLRGELVAGRSKAMQVCWWAGCRRNPANGCIVLGDDMVVRLPRILWAVPKVEKEHR